jgi:hypothetical protein
VIGEAAATLPVGGGHMVIGEAAATLPVGGGHMVIGEAAATLPVGGGHMVIGKVEASPVFAESAATLLIADRARIETTATHETFDHDEDILETPQCEQRKLQKRLTQTGQFVTTKVPENRK